MVDDHQIAETAHPFREHHAPAGHGLDVTAGARPAIVGMRPAPVQVSYLGLPGTCALPGVDYILADRLPRAHARVGDLVVVRPGGRVPVDGVIASGAASMVDAAADGFIFAKNFLAASRPQAIFEIKIKEFAQAVHQKVQPRKELETVPEEELNAILDKISQSGYDSLTDFEQKRLFKASQKND